MPRPSGSRDMIAWRGQTPAATVQEASNLANFAGDQARACQHAVVATLVGGATDCKAA